MEVIVDDSQLSLAIGKKGQNVRLARQTPWLEDRYQERGGEAPGSRVADGRAGGARRSGFGPDRSRADREDVEKLLEAGIGTVEKLGAMTPEQLEEIQGIGPKTWSGFRSPSTAITPSLKRSLEEGPADGAAPGEPEAPERGRRRKVGRRPRSRLPPRPPKPCRGGNLRGRRRLRILRRAPGIRYDKGLRLSSLASTGVCAGKKFVGWAADRRP